MEIKSKIIKSGNSYQLRIPKALVDCKIVELGKIYKATLTPVEQENLAVSIDMVRVPAEA